MRVWKILSLAMILFSSFVLTLSAEGLLKDVIIEGNLNEEDRADLNSILDLYRDQSLNDELISNAENEINSRLSLSSLYVSSVDQNEDGDYIVTINADSSSLPTTISSFVFTGDELTEGERLLVNGELERYIGRDINDESLSDEVDVLLSDLPFLSSITVSDIRNSGDGVVVELDLRKVEGENTDISGQIQTGQDLNFFQPSQMASAESTVQQGEVATDWYRNLPISAFSVTGVEDESAFSSLLDSFVGKPFDSQTESEISSYLEGLDNVDYFILGATRGSDDSLVLTLEIFETPTLSGINITGNTLFSSQQLSSVLGYSVGSYLKNVDVNALSRIIEGYYRQNGYDGVTCSVRLSYDVVSNTESFEITINEGSSANSASATATENPSSEEASASSSAPWYEGMPIKDFEYTGLQNVNVSTVDRLMRDYRGEIFNNDTFQSIFSTLYGQSWMEYATMDAERDETDGGLIVRLNFLEYPMISEITISGNNSYNSRTLLSEQSYTVGSFLGANNVPQSAEAIRNYYLARGYKDATVTGESAFDEATNTETIHFTVNEGQQFKVRDIVYEGVSAFSARDLNKLLTSKRKGFFTAGNFVEANLSSDISALETHYLNAGYMNMRVVSVDTPDVTEEKDKTGFLNIVFTIDEGDRWYFGPITFSGNERFSDSEISDLIDISAGDIHDQSKLTDVFAQISTLYYDNGYINANIVPVPTFDEENHTVSYHINITEGGQTVIEAIRIVGITKTKPYVFERELTIHEGDIFDRSQVIRSQQNIYNTGLIKNIRLELYPGETENGIIIQLEVEEGNQMELQFGATFGGTVDGFPISGFLQWSDKNLGGTGRTLSISTTLSPDTQSATIGISNGWVGDHRWSNGISFTFTHQLIDDELQRGDGSAYYDGRDDAKVTYPLGYSSAEEWYGSDMEYPTDEYLMEYHYLRFALGYDTGYTFNFLQGNLTLGAGISIGLNRAFYDDKYNPYNDLILKYHDNWQFSNRLSFRVVWDARDFVTNTTKGYLLSVNYMYAGGFLGGLSNYNRLSVGAQGFIPLYSYIDEEERNRSLVLSLTSNVSFMFDQYWNRNGVWGRYTARQGATEYEMLYIDGMNIGRGFDTITDLSFLWHNQIDLSFPVVIDLVNVEAFASMTGATSTLVALSNFNNIDWYMAIGAGFKLAIPGFPLGLYLVKNATLRNGDFQWEDGYIFGMKLVLAISTSLM